MNTVGLTGGVAVAGLMAIVFPTRSMSTQAVTHAHVGFGGLVKSPTSDPLIRRIIPHCDLIGRAGEA
jgi:hypothetical protein